MKKLIAIWFLMFFTVIGNAQINIKNKYSDLNLAQLNLVLSKSIKTRNAGLILTITGTALIITGGILITDNLSKAINNTTSSGDEGVTGLILIEAGFISDCIGIPLWVVGNNRKAKIKVELVKFNSKGSASINGIGLKIRF